MPAYTTPWNLPAESSTDVVDLSHNFADLANAANAALNDLKSQAMGSPVLPGTSSLDTVTGDATYTVLDANGNAGRPAGEQSGILRSRQLTTTASLHLWQGYANSSLWSRYYGSGGWSSWVRLDAGGTQVAPTLASGVSL
ncbi:MAG TPA: pyocin knob domain-containing protein, partial [Intrasporangium sp.]|uniref:pyocin knob domain-containing protein n=1 Tax=Intrasporangium sp. TaxID=1925024 RepID=UPI002D76A0E7